MRILITRPRSEAEALVEILSDRGIEACVSPVMEVIPIEFEPPEDATYQAIIVTSGNAVDALRGIHARLEIPVFCVGDATARRLAETDFADIRSASGDSEDLVALINRDLEPGNGALLYLSGMMIAADIGAALGDAGFKVDRRVVYRAQAVAAPSEDAVTDLAQGGVDGVLLYSPRSARILVDHLRAAELEGIVPEMTAYCISHAAADVARALPWRKVAVASRPNQADLLALLPKS